MSWEASEWARRQQTGSASCKALLMVLATYADKNGGSCFPSQELLATESNQSIDSVQRHLKNTLVPLGLVTKDRLPSRNGRWKRLNYHLNLGVEIGSGASVAERSNIRKGLHREPPPLEKNVQQTDICFASMRPHHAATGRMTRPQSLRHKSSIETSIEPSPPIVSACVADRQHGSRGRYERLEVVQNRIAQRLGIDGWLVLGKLSEEERLYVTDLERSGKLTVDILDRIKSEHSLACVREMPPT